MKMISRLDRLAQAERCAINKYKLEILDSMAVWREHGRLPKIAGGWGEARRKDSAKWWKEGGRGMDEAASYKTLRHWVGRRTVNNGGGRGESHGRVVVAHCIYYMGCVCGVRVKGGEWGKAWSLVVYCNRPH